MYIGLLHLHNTLRWLILLIALVALLKYFMGWFSRQNWKKPDNTLSLVFTVLMDIQLLTGLVLYFFVSPITKAAFQDFGAAMKNADLRFYAIEHLLMMVVAVALVHIGRVRAKKAADSRAKFGNSLVFFGIAYVVILAAIPWDRVF